MNDDETSHEGSTAALLTSVLAQLAGRPLKVSDVTKLRDAFESQGLTTRGELDIAFAIETRAADRCRPWSDLFVSLATDFLVWGDRPTGVLTDENARWLLGRVDASHTSAGLFLLINVLDEAPTVPDWYADAVRTRALAVFSTTSRGTSPRQAA